MKNTFPRLATLTAAITLFPILAHAHPGHVGHDLEGLGAGLAHPAMGIDHLLAMIAVGLWAVQLGGRARWIVPASFVSLMAVGGALGAAGISLPLVESGIMASLLILGVLIAAAARLPVIASAAIVGVFALFHGAAHGAEMPATATGLAYCAGFMLTTLAFHAMGIAGGSMAKELAQTAVVRVAGAAIALAGVIFCFN